MTVYTTHDVEVDGGTLRYARWGGGSNVVLAIHGITGSHRHMQWLAAQLCDGALGNDFTVLAPDLRGRGRSSDIEGPWGMAAHADDMVALLDHAGVDQALVLGHSMGGFVAVVLAHRAPERVSRLVLVDGGLMLDLGPLADLPVDKIVGAIIGPALDRLRMTFESHEAFFEYWRPHPALNADWSERLEESYAYELVGEPGAFRSCVREDAVIADGGSELKTDDVTQALAALKHPTVFVRSPRGILNQEPPLYGEAQLTEAATVLPGFRWLTAPDVNHYTVLLGKGAGFVADLVRAELPEES